MNMFSDVWLLVFLFNGVITPGMVVDKETCVMEMNSTALPLPMCVNLKQPTRKIYPTGPNEAERRYVAVHGEEGLPFQYFSEKHELNRKLPQDIIDKCKGDGCHILTQGEFIDHLTAANNAGQRKIRQELAYADWKSKQEAKKKEVK